MESVAADRGGVVCVDGRSKWMAWVPNMSGGWVAGTSHTWQAGLVGKTGGRGWQTLVVVIGGRQTLVTDNRHGCRSGTEMTKGESVSEEELR